MAGWKKLEDYMEEASKTIDINGGGDGSYKAELPDECPQEPASNVELKEMHTLDEASMELARFMVLDEEIQGTLRLGVPKDLHKLIVAFTRKLVMEPRNFMLVTNRCKLYLQLRCFRRALNDADRIFRIDPRSLDGVYYKVKALFGLDRHGDALEVLNQYKASGLDKRGESVVEELLRRANLFINMKLTGDFDMAYFLEEDEVLYHECPDFTGPIEVKELGKHGRGLIATEDMKKGQIIMVAKPLLLFYDDFAEQSQEMLRVTFHEKELMLMLYNLYAGPDLKYIPLEDARFNVDNERLTQAISFNHFTSGPKPDCFYDSDKRPEVKGVWYLPSFLNHSCFDCNCFWEVYGGVLFIRALKDVKTGDELLVSYFPTLGGTYHERLHIHNQYGIVCACTLCQLDKNETAEVREERTQLLEQLYQLDKTNSSLSTEVEKSIIRIKEISGDRAPMIYLINPYLLLSSYYDLKESYLHAALALIKVYEIVSATDIAQDMGLMMIGRIIKHLLRGSDIYGKEYLASVKFWIGEMKKEAEVVFGSESEHVLKNAASDFIQELAQYGIDFFQYY